MDFNDFTIFDAFVKDKLVYLILSINNIPLDNSQIIVKLNNNVLQFKYKYEKNKYEPILIFVYDIYNNIDLQSTLDFELIYKSQVFKKNIEYVSIDNKKNLALTTLFKDDYNLFPSFYKYYKSQGVEHFYMYYNGVLTSDIRNVYNYDDVTLIEWNFRYWNPTTYKYNHHAQMGQIHHALYKYGKQNYEYMIFNDLDEYLFIPDIKLIDHINNNKQIDVFGFCNTWSKTVDDTKIFKKDLIVAETLRYGVRSKNIYKLDSIKTLYIHHYDVSTIPNLTMSLNIMYHFYNWTMIDRDEKTHKKIELNLDFLHTL